jgi:hypothetical protein
MTTGIGKCGCYGTLIRERGYLELDSYTFMSLKINGMYDTLLEYLNDLVRYDVHGEGIPLVEKGWLTPMRGLRKEGWVLRLKFGDSLGGMGTLNLFFDYIQKLNSNFGNKAFRMFNNADLSILQRVP